MFYEICDYGTIHAYTMICVFNLENVNFMKKVLYLINTMTYRYNNNRPFDIANIHIFI